MTKLRLAIAAIAATLVANSASAVELLSNGTFEGGNSGFSSGYAHTPGNYWGEGTYGLDDNPHDGHAYFSAFGDHTTGDGLMMVVNGSGVADVLVWGDGGVPIIQNSDYTFSFWMASAHPDSPAQVRARINGEWLAPTAFGTSTTGQWAQFSYVWNSGAATSADIQLVNQNLAYQGNDFVLDDLSFKGAGAVPEPATWALMIGGFGMAGANLRRRRSVAAAI